MNIKYEEGLLFTTIEIHFRVTKGDVPKLSTNKN